MDSGKSLFLEHLYKSCSKKLFRVAYPKMNYDKEKTREIVQETFAIACLKVDKLYQSESPESWLLEVEKRIVKREQFRYWSGKIEEGNYKFEGIIVNPF